MQTHPPQPATQAERVSSNGSASTSAGPPVPARNHHDSPQSFSGSNGSTDSPQAVQRPARRDGLPWKGRRRRNKEVIQLSDDLAGHEDTAPPGMQHLDMRYLEQVYKVSWSGQPMASSRACAVVGVGGVGGEGAVCECGAVGTCTCMCSCAFVTTLPPLPPPPTCRTLRRSRHPAAAVAAPQHTA